jgi:ABC-type multidrug transport system ATPase subunit
MIPAVFAESVSKGWGQTRAVDSVSFAVQQGELFGFLGPDGAGKTTLFRMMATLMVPDSGWIQVFGHNSAESFRTIRSQIGYMPGRFSLYLDLSVRENLEFFASLYGTDFAAARNYIEPIYAQIAPFEHRLARQLSGGMKQKLALCAALIHRPRLLLLDEPTTGVDPVSRTEFWDLLSELKMRDITIIVSTPYMDEAERCDRVALMNGGKILAMNTPQGIVEGADFKVLSLRTNAILDVLTLARTTDGIEAAWPFGDTVHLHYRQGDPLEMFRQRAHDAGVHCEQVLEIKPSIEDVFLRRMSQ